MAKVKYALAQGVEHKKMDKDYRFINFKTAIEATNKWIEEETPSKKMLEEIKAENRDNETFADLKEIERVLRDGNPNHIRKYAKVSAKWLESVIKGLDYDGFKEDRPKGVVFLEEISLAHACKLTEAGLLDKTGELTKIVNKTSYDPEVQARREFSSFIDHKMELEDIDLVLDAVTKAIAEKDEGI